MSTPQLSDACPECHPGDAPAAPPQPPVTPHEDGLTLAYTCPLCGLSWLTRWVVTAWAAERNITRREARTA